VLEVEFSPRGKRSQWTIAGLWGLVPSPEEFPLQVDDSKT